MGIVPVLVSYPQAMVWGANPITLVSGGNVMWVMVVSGTFWLAWKAFGLEVAGREIVPLVFSSTGIIWLFGRITGGHLLTLAWHVLAYVGLCEPLLRVISGSETGLHLQLATSRPLRPHVNGPT
jgi:hypothetical protein